MLAKDYKTVLENASDEFVEKRSRFIGYCKPVKTEQEAVNIGMLHIMYMPIH